MVRKVDPSEVQKKKLEELVKKYEDLRESYAGSANELRSTIEDLKNLLKIEQSLLQVIDQKVDRLVRLGFKVIYEAKRDTGGEGNGKKEA